MVMTAFTESLAWHAWLKLCKAWFKLSKVETLVLVVIGTAVAEARTNKRGSHRSSSAHGTIWLIANTRQTE